MIDFTNSPYKLEQLEEIPVFKELCEYFYELAPNEEAKSILKSILVDGNYNGYSTYTGITNKDNPDVDLYRRASLAKLFLLNPTAFDFFVKNNIRAFTGSDANTLASVISSGAICSYQNLVENDIEVLSGEEWSIIKNHERDFVSFTDVFDIAHDYSCQESKYVDPFGIIYCTSRENINMAPRITVRSDISEIGVKDRFLFENINCILVPIGRAENINKILESYGIEMPVFEIEWLLPKFYFYSDFGFNILDRNEFEEFKKLINERNEKLNKNCFSTEEIATVASKRPVKGILSRIFGRK